MRSKAPRAGFQFCEGWCHQGSHPGVGGKMDAQKWRECRKYSVVLSWMEQQVYGLHVCAYKEEKKKEAQEEEEI